MQGLGICLVKCGFMLCAAIRTASFLNIKAVQK